MAEGTRSKKRSGTEKDLDGTVTVSKLLRQKVTSVMLNYDELLCIFKLLDIKTLKECALVCKSWLNAAYAPELWKHQIPTMNPSRLNEQTASSLKVRGISAIMLPPIEMEKYNLSVAFTNCAERAQIKTLTLKGLKTQKLKTKTSLSRLFPVSFTSLLSLTLCHDGGVIDEDGFRRLLLPLINLTSLSIQGNQSHDKKGYCRKQTKFDYFKVVFSCLPNLKLLDISCLNEWGGLINMGSTASDLVPGLLQLTVGGKCDGWATLKRICQKFPNLEHLALGIHPHDEVDFDAAHNLTALESAASLESVRIGHTSCLSFSPEPVLAICAAYNNLKAIDISVYAPYFFGEFEHKHFVCLSENASSLKALILCGHGLLPESMNVLMPKLRELEVLVVGMCEEVEELMQLIKKHMPKLKSLQGVEVSDSQYDDIDCLKYITTDIECGMIVWTEHIWMQNRETSGTFQDTERIANVLPDTPEWHEATGSRFFRLACNEI